MDAMSPLGIWLFLALTICASQEAFNVNDDVFAYPQYDIDFLPEFILEPVANAKLERQLARMHHQDEADVDVQEEYHEIAHIHGRPFLCTIPELRQEANVTEEKPSEEDRKKELSKAADRGWELLKEMEGKQCLFYSIGWWSYTFCYNSHVKQFHSHQPGVAGARAFPPQEDPATPSYYLGRYDAKNTKDQMPAQAKNSELIQLQTKAETSYLVQKMQGGTPCDLTGKDRTIEIQFHCYPQSTDRIGWIKETATCAYLMVVYTPRLCNDVAFQLPKDSQAHVISCQEILAEEQIPPLDELRIAQHIEDGQTDQPIMIGNVEYGAMKILGPDAKKIEKGRIVMTAEEKAEIVIMQKDGLIHGPNKAQLKKLQLSPEDVEAFQKQIQDMAGKRDWKIELVDGDGQIKLRGVVSDDDEDESKKESKQGTNSDDKKKKQG